MNRTLCPYSDYYIAIYSDQAAILLLLRMRRKNLREKGTVNVIPSWILKEKRLYRLIGKFLVKVLYIAKKA